MTIDAETCGQSSPIERPAGGEPGRVCTHLFNSRDDYPSFARHFTGRGLEYDLVCPDCARAPETIDPQLRAVCRSCFRRLDREGAWDGIVGRPQVRERLVPLEFVHRDTRPDGPPAGAIRDLRPVRAEGRAAWIALADDAVLAVDLARGTVRELARVPASGVDLGAPVSLHTSSDGRFAALVNTRGQHGVVLDLTTGAQTMTLDRGSYYIEHCVFSTAFFELDGRVVLAHATAWNRLDVSDPATGELLTPREPASYRSGDSPPAHYLDYFHCGLTVSPSDRWMADNGWAWAPVGAPRTWSLPQWLKENAWESEDGPSVRSLCQRLYYWDGPVCWISEDELAVWGYGGDDEWLIPAVRIFDVRSGREVRWFAGPEGQLVCDRFLFSFAPESGTSVWDVATGERLHHDPAFCPTRYHPATRQFVSLLPDGGFRLTRLIDARGE